MSRYVDVLALTVDRYRDRYRNAKEAIHDLFKKDLGSFVRFYEFISQIVPVDDAELEKLAVYSRHLRPLLRQTEDEEALDLAGVELSHYRLGKQAEHHINLKDGQGEYRLTPADQAGTDAVLESLDVHSEIAAAVLRDDQVKNRFIRLLLGEILQNRRRAPSVSQAL